MTPGLMEHFRLPETADGESLLPVDIAADAEVAELRLERYVGSSGIAAHAGGALRRLYYSLRPLMPVPVRRVLQRRALAGWQQIDFPSWPVDTSVERVLRAALIEAMDAAGMTQVPFVWFWPEGKQGCVVMTHDVETARGRDFTRHLMAAEKDAGMVASYEIVPEQRYEVSPDYLTMIGEGGCEVCVHGLNHDGRLFTERGEFERRASLINEYGRRFGARGFRSPVMYRNAEWMSALDFSYDMSFPNVAHLDPQRGGCCTVFPYFIGDLLELPLTCTQDYTLLHVLRDSSLNLWRRQVDMVLAEHGLLTFIVHPDYSTKGRAAVLHSQLIAMLRLLIDERDLWSALPGEVDTWWRQRAAMRVGGDSDGWYIVGEGAERARLGWAVRTADGLALTPDGHMPAIPGSG